MKVGNSALFKWWVQVVLTGFFTLVVYQFGGFEFLWVSDQTKLSFLILALFVGTTVTTGYLSKIKPRCQPDIVDHPENIKVFTQFNNYCWFVAEKMTSLGMIGTVTGFLIMLGSAFLNLDVTDKVGMTAVIGEMAVGMSTALTTTLVGLVCSVLAQAQLVVLENDDAK
jgi:hypothetical protein